MINIAKTSLTTSIPNSHWLREDRCRDVFLQYLSSLLILFLYVYFLYHHPYFLQFLIVFLQLFYIVQYTHFYTLDYM